jgi:hypothetical protein
MAIYRSLVPLFTDMGTFVPANQVFSDGATSAPNAPVLASPAWKPACCDCLDLDACTKLFAQPVILLGKIAKGCPPPAVYWTQLSPTQNIWGLTGQGAQLGTTFAFNGPRNAP